MMAIKLPDYVFGIPAEVIRVGPSGEVEVAKTSCDTKTEYFGDIRLAWYATLLQQCWDSKLVLVDDDEDRDPKLNRALASRLILTSTYGARADQIFFCRKAKESTLSQAILDMAASLDISLELPCLLSDFFDLKRQPDDARYRKIPVEAVLLASHAPGSGEWKRDLELIRGVYGDTPGVMQAVKEIGKASRKLYAMRPRR